MGTEESTPFAYCGKDNPIQNEISSEIERRERRLTAKLIEQDNMRKKEKSEDLEKSLDDAYSEIQEVTNKKNAMSMRYLRLEEEYRKDSSEKTKLLDQLQKSTQRYDTMINSHKLLEEQFETEIEQYKAYNARLQEELNSPNDTQTDKALKDEVEKLTRIIAEYKANPDDDGRSIDMIGLQQENESLKTELHGFQAQLMQNQQTIAILNQQMFALQSQMNSNGYGAADMPSVNKSLKAVMSHETNFSEEVIRDTIDRTREVGDVDTFVRDRYGTIDKGKNYNVGRDSDESDDSSLSEQEKLEIEIAKRNDMNDEDVKQMQKEINYIQKTMAAKKLSVIDDDENEYDAFAENAPPPAAPGNLFRYASKMNWDTDAVTAQKKAMKEQMIKLLQQQGVKTQNNNDET